MFDYSLIHWTTFLAAAILLNLMPGPDMAFILAQTARGGRKAGFSALFGIWTGALMHVLMAAAGLSALLVSSAIALSFVKWVGAVYLIWLGIQAFRSSGTEGGSMTSLSFASPFKIYRQGALVSLLNPKVAVFFLAFLPQFIVEGAGPIWAQLFLHGFLIIGVAAFIEPPLILLSHFVARKIRHHKSVGTWMNRGLGGLFVFLGLKLVVSEK
ncbi:MAG: LysE family translocator [Sneathiella sp.]